MLIRSRLFLRALWWRRGFSAAVLIVGVISAAVAVIGPLYARAAGESTLTDELRDAGAQAGLAFSESVQTGLPGAIGLLSSQVHNAAQIPGYGTPITGESLVATIRATQDPTSSPTTLVTRSGVCANVVLTSGRCPTAAGEVMVPSTATATRSWRVGQQVALSEAINDPLTGVGDGAPLGNAHIVGIYRPLNFDDPYWFGRPYFTSQFGAAVSSAVKLGIDAVFVAATEFEQTVTPVLAEADVDVPLVPTQVRLNDVARLRGDVAAVARRYPRAPDNPGTPAMHTDLPTVLDAAARDHRDVNTATLVIVLELAALSVLVLFEVVSGSVEARGDEIALAKLRGLSPLSTVGLTLAEPVSLLLAAAPLGFGLGYLVTHLLAGSALVYGTPVLVTPPAFYALAGAFAGSAVAALLAARSTLRRPVLAQWRTTGRALRSPRSLLVLDGVLAAAAAGTAIALRLGNPDHPRSIFLLAPALLVFAVALVGVRVVPWLGGLGLGPTRATRRIATFLAVRHAVRRPGGLRVATLLAVAAGLAVFAVCGEAVARSNRDARAQSELGASQRLAVLLEAGHDPEQIVNRVDPAGTWAMATATWSPDGGPAESTVVATLLGVQPRRFAATAFAVRGQLSPSAIATAIDAGTPPPATFAATTVHVVLDTSALHGDHPSVAVNVRHADQRVEQVRAGTVQLGVHSYTATVDCAKGCSFTGIALVRSVNAANVITGTTVLQAVSTGTAQPLIAHPAAVAKWRADELGYSASSTFTPSAAGLTWTYRAEDASSPILAYPDSPSAMPIVATPASTSTQARNGGVYDYSATAYPYTVARRASPLPVALDDGAIANLDYLRIRLPHFDTESVWSVWLGPHAPADAVQRLERAGLLVQNVRTEHARVAELGRQGPALGLLLLLVCAVAAGVLAVGGTAIALLAQARRRGYELAALRMIGVRARTLRRSAVAEQALLLGSALVLGLPAGFAAAALVLPVVPEFSDTTPVVLRYSPPVIWALLTAAAFAVLLVLTAVLAGSALIRSATAERLREAQR
jgi:putative ABC transport system permease protein